MIQITVKDHANVEELRLPPQSENRTILSNGHLLSPLFLVVQRHPHLKFTVALQQSPILQNSQEQPRFGFSGATPGMVANIPSNLLPSPINDPHSQVQASLDSEHHQRREARQPISLSASSGLHSPPEYLKEEPTQHQVRDMPAALPLPPHANIEGLNMFHPQQYPPLHQPIDPQFNPLDPVARMQLMQMQQQREQYFQDHPESRGDENDHFLEAINAVLGPMPAEGDHGPEIGPQPQQQMFPFLNPDEPPHPNHPQHQMWLQQRQQREILRRRQQEYFEEQQRRRRQQSQHEPE